MAVTTILRCTLHHLFQHSSFMSLNGFTGTTPLPPQLQRKPSVRQYPKTPNPFSAIPSKGLKHGKTLWMLYVFKMTKFIYPTRHNEQEYRNFLIYTLLSHAPKFYSTPMRKMDTDVSSPPRLIVRLLSRILSMSSTLPLVTSSTLMYRAHDLHVDSNSFPASSPRQ